jgi:cytochrome c
MDSFTLNKAAGAVLMVLILVMGVGIVSDIIFHPTIPGKPGYEIVVASAEDSTSEVGAVPEVTPISERLVEASAEDGAKVFKKCASCHDFSADGKNKTGPLLWDIVGRKPGAHEGFGYSSAMTEFGSQNPEWTYENLDHFLESPRNYISGTAMASFGGLRKPEERADVIAFLREQSEAPKPLPAVEEAAPAAEETAPAAEEAAPAESEPAKTE